MALQVVDKIFVPRNGKRPRRRPKTLVADRGYDAKKLRTELRKRNIQPIIPARKYKKRKIPKIGRPVGSYQPLQYQDRWKVERAFAWLYKFRRVTVRWDYYLKNYSAWVTLACIVILFRQL